MKKSLLVVILSVFSLTIKAQTTLQYTSTGVGINLSSPQATLDVTRGTAPNGTAAFRGSEQNNTSHFNYSAAEWTYIRGGKSTSNIIISDVSNNVAIGSGTPLEKLHVFGNIRASSLAGTGTRSVGADANGNLVPISTSSNMAFSAGTASPINVSNSEANMNLSIELYDLGNNFFANGNSFTVPSTGIYDVLINITWSGNASGYRQIILRDGNGTLIRASTAYPPNSNSFKQIVPFHLYLTQGTNVYFYLTQSSGTNLTASGGEGFDTTVLSVHKVN